LFAREEEFTAKLKSKLSTIEKLNRDRKSKIEIKSKRQNIVEITDRTTESNSDEATKESKEPKKQET